MRVLSLILIAMIFLVSGVGVYRTWFTISRLTPAAGSSMVGVSVAADTAKIKQDVETIRNQATEMTNQITKGVSSNDPASANSNSNAQ